MPYKRAAVILIQNNAILLLHRHKNGMDYFVFPGGHIEKHETPEETVLREIKEEASIDITVEKLLFEHEDSNAHQYYFLATRYSGTITLGGEEKQRQTKENRYSFEWVPIDSIQNTNLKPEEVKKKLVQYVKN